MAIGEILARHDEVMRQTMKLYHGSGYKQEELMPGFKRSGKLTNWDRYESNDYLYASSDKNSAILLGITSAWEKIFDLHNAKIDHSKREVHLEFYSGKIPTFAKLYLVPAYLYTIAMSDADGWAKGKNPFNGIETEYKTKRTIKNNIIDTETINAGNVLKDFKIFMSSASQ